MSDTESLHIIAELGSNVFGSSGFDPDRCLRLLDAAEMAGATHAKAQLYRHSHFPESEGGAKWATEFPRSRLDWFVDQCPARGLSPGFSVFEPEDADDAVAAGAWFLKLAAREEGNVTLLIHCLDCVKDSGIRLFRSVDWSRLVSDRSFLGSMALPGITTLACVPTYPTVSTPANLHLLPELVPAPFGWSSHTPYWSDCVEAVDYGAVAVEKHICLDQSDPEGPWSLGPEQFFQMIVDLRIAQERNADQ